VGDGARHDLGDRFALVTSFVQRTPHGDLARGSREVIAALTPERKRAVHSLDRERAVVMCEVVCLALCRVPGYAG
jgi:hypothetical protein